MLWSHPLLGVGPDNFRFLYGAYLDLEEWDHKLHSNNMYLEFLVGSGIPGGLLFLWLCFRILGSLNKVWKRLANLIVPCSLELRRRAWRFRFTGSLIIFLSSRQPTS